MSYLVIDNFLPEEEFKTIRDIVFSESFPWYTGSGVADAYDHSDKYFVHLFYTDHRPNSDNFNCIAPILNKLDAKALLRAKANMYLKNAEIISHGQHVDFEFEHKGFILYLNTNDGFTELADGTRVESVANRGLFFEPHILHNSTNCTNELCRVNISINYF